MRRVYTVYTVFNFGARKIGFAESKNVYVFFGGGGREGGGSQLGINVNPIALLSAAPRRTRAWLRVDTGAELTATHVDQLPPTFSCIVINFLLSEKIILRTMIKN